MSAGAAAPANTRGYASTVRFDAPSRYATREERREAQNVQAKGPIVGGMGSGKGLFLAAGKPCIAKPCGYAFTVRFAAPSRYATMVSYM
jgi:hypothetical protein